MARTKSGKLLALLFLAGFGIVVVWNAWLSDDAYITFRTVDNFINGYGLTWNVAERVQVYTHPLWMFLLSAVYLFTHEVFFSSLLLSIAVSLVAVFVVATRIARSTPAALLGITILALSKAFVDYSTSGLENPLTHMLFALFLLVYLRSEPSPRTLLCLSLLAALGMTNRMDTALLFLPLLVVSLVRLGTVKGLYAAGAGIVPFVLWELFSLFYYGFLFPNTAYAKLNSGLISDAELFRQGLFYLLNSFRWDPLTLVVTGLGIAVPLVAKRRRGLPVVAGLVLYLLYVVRIGGGFMSGRFLSAPLLGAVVLLVDNLWNMRTIGWLALFALVLGLGLGAPRSPLFAGGSRVETDPAHWVDPHGIADERANYYHNTGLLVARQRAEPPDHDWALEGRAARLAGPAVVQKASVGFFGYFAGPQVYVVDLLGLGDPLLARLPPNDATWAIGHFGRSAPDGYVETLVTGENRIEDRNLAVYYDKLSVVIRGDLFDVGRLVEIWRFNTGAYDHYRDAYATFRGDAFIQHLQVVNPTDSPYAYVYVWNNGAAEAFLLDDASRRGSVYSLDWIITASGARFEGSYEQHISSGNPLSDHETLNVGVYFSDSPELVTYDIFERRFWFRIEDDGRLVIILPGAEWHNPQAPHGAWALEDIDGIIRDRAH